MSGQSEVIIYDDLERGEPIDVRRIGKLGARDLHDVLGYLSSARSVDQAPAAAPRALVVDGLHVTAQTVPNMTVKVDIGIGVAPASGSSGLVGSPAATSLESNLRFINKRAASAAVAVNAAAGSIRYDLIEIGPATTSPDTVEVDETRTIGIYDESLKRFLPSATPRIKMRHGEGEIFYTAGTAGIANSCPAPTAGRVPLAVVRVLPGAVSITQQDILDVRQFLAEAMSIGSESPSRIDTDEISIDVPHDGGDARKTVVNIDVIVKGVRGAFRTDALFQLDATGGSKAYDSFLDPNFTDFSTYAGWTYLYLIVTDDRGLRYSRAHCTTEVDVAAGDFSHAGTLVISKVAPSLSNGSLAPSAAIKTPFRAGNSTCTPGTGKAVCIGAVYWSSSKIQHGIRMFGGKCTFVINDALLPALFTGAWTHTPAGAASTTQTSAYQADLTVASNPKGPVAFDVWSQIQLTTGTANANGPHHRFRLYEFKAGDANSGKLVDSHETTHPTGAASTYFRVMVWRGLPVSRIAPQRGSIAGGMKLQLESVSGSVHGCELSSSVAPVTKLAGYEWPQGPIVA